MTNLRLFSIFFLSQQCEDFHNVVSKLYFHAIDTIFFYMDNIVSIEKI